VAVGDGQLMTALAVALATGFQQEVI